MSNASFSVDQNLMVKATSPSTGACIKARLNRIQAQLLGEALLQYAGNGRKSSVGSKRKVVVSGTDLARMAKWQL